MANENILIVEDENIVAKDIQLSLKKLGYNVAGICSSGKEAIEAVAEKNPDLVLMDIMLKGPMNGIEATEEIRQKFDKPIIYLTAYADESTMVKAKITEPYGYIIKPFKEIDLHTAIEMAIYKHKKVNEIKKERDFLYSIIEKKDGKGMLFVKSNSQQVKIKTESISFVEALKDYVIIHVDGVRYTIHSTMKDIEKRLPPNQFMRVHRSFIINLERIDAIESSELIMEGDKKRIPVGGSYKDELQKRLNFI